MSKKNTPTFFIILTAFLLAACDNERLLENLTQDQANQVLAILQQHNISANKSGNLKAGYTIQVDEIENTAALSIISQYQLPWPADIQIGQAFPDGALVASPNAEQVRVLSLLEQRLGQSLRTIAQVVNARVHISYPPLKNGMADKTLTNHVGVLISYKGDINQSLFIPQVKSLIKNSLDDIKYENISVVLFDTPPIQYTQPLKLSSPSPSKWLIFTTAVVLPAAAIFIFLLKRVSRRFKVGDVMNKSKRNSQGSVENAP
ncbi:type III secretion system inner membrane ring lipoprotein SctJ [Erwinia tasmaniensis]|uniref:Lipoprotein n=1 Tax=Erwinia tasmaniensis (strain DSM 17950 / CFBP 7177 / CIP 109463 / NCPPB 4357 / Et1/99) TaxID=465817 RepID=B2VEG1_ERWT9|nr:type III secretion inner membrane ring lipoprotein SctJ [Erwinia tasmaniensis]CAO96959.1 Type III secretion system [Erwinia tasmaniensis Et1/99]